MDPLNLDLIFATENDVKTLRPVTVLDITDGMTKNFHPDGLFSLDIFGKPGGELRNRRFSYVDLGVEIFHPTLFKAIVRMKSLYGEIMAGKAYAVWDKTLKDFVKSTIAEGETGYNFFVSHFKELVFEERKAHSRSIGIQLIEKYRKQPFIKRLLVLPAGLRDYHVDDTGKPSEDEINTLYRKVMKMCLSLNNIAIETNLEYLDSTRMGIQNAVMDLYNHLVNMLRGKKKAIEGHWTKRRIVNSTRNVITSTVPQVTEYGGDRSISPNQTVVGLHQFLRSVIPVAVKAVREKFSSMVFPSNSGQAVLIDPKTLKKELVPVDAYHYDRWMTYDGVEKTFASYADQHLRHLPMRIAGKYMMLLYQDGSQFKMFQDIDELPEHLDRKNVRPISLTEMLYICAYELAEETYGYFTRYPVGGYGGIYPSGVYLRSTVNSLVLKELDDGWSLKSNKAMEFPIHGEKFFESMSPAACHLALLGADFDGDKMSFIAVWTEEAKEEIRNLLKKWEFYISGQGTMSFSMSDDVIDITLDSMTKRIQS